MELNDQLEQQTAAFEAAWAEHGVADINDFVDPATTDLETLCELIRLDLEFRWRQGEKPVVETYLERFSQYTFPSTRIAELAFEEYRLRHQAGEGIAPAEFANRLNINTQHWPVWAKDSVSDSAVSGLPQVGDEFHGFELVGVLGQGAFGSVFLARELQLSHRLVALKVTEVSDLEPQSLARLQHTNIIPIYSLQADERLQSICMPFLGVATLRDFTGQASRSETGSISGKALISTIVGKRASTIVDSVPQHQTERVASELKAVELPSRPSDLDGLGFQQTVLWLSAQIADGLSYAHGRGIIHGDLKPGNVLISDDGHPLILDFHLARISDQQQAAASLVGGTLPYMSSKHLHSLIAETKLDASCDLFSLGVVMYEALSGKLPYETLGSDDRAIEQMMQQRSKSPVPLRSLAPWVSRDVESIVHRCLAAEGRGYATAAQLHQDLTCQLNDLPLVYAANRSIRERAAKWARRHPKLTSTASVGIVATLLLITVVAIAWSALAGAAESVAINQSRDFVQSIEAARAPLFVTDENILVPMEQLQRLDQLLDERIGEEVGQYRERLNELPDAIRETELNELGYGVYWVAYQKYKRAKVLAGSERTQLQQQALDRLVDVSQLRDTTPNPAITKLMHEIESDLDPAKQHEPPPDLPLELMTLKDQMLRAVELFRNGEPTEALAAVERLVAEEPRNPQVWMLLGQNLVKQDQLEKAELCFSTALNLDPDFPWAHFQRGSCLLKGDQPERALVDFDRSSELLPDQPVVHLNRALAYIGTRQWQSALADLDQAIKLGARQTRAHYLRHRVLKQLGEDQLADQALDQFISLEPVDETSWISRGLAQAKLDRPEQALADFQSALAINPDSVESYQNIATVYAELLDQPLPAIDAMSRLIELRPTDPVALVTRGVLYARTGNFDSARKDAMEVLKQRPSADLYFRAAGVFALGANQNQRNRLIATDLLRKASLMDPRLVISRIKSDSDLDQIRDTPEFNQLVEQLTALALKKATSK